MLEAIMTGVKTLTIVAALLAGGTSLAMAQNGLPTGSQRPVAGGANGGWYPGYGYAVPPLYDYAAPTYGYAAPAYVAPAPIYTAPPVYAAPVYTAPPVYTVPAPLYGYYAAPYGPAPGTREWAIEKDW
jgi:hypothetical protein